MPITCKGTNCSALYGNNHSKECWEEHERILFEATLQDHINHGGWLCYFCKYNGQDNQRYNQFCSKCHRHR